MDGWNEEEGDEREERKEREVLLGGSYQDFAIAATPLP